jgi:hypothetical protein
MKRSLTGFIVITISGLSLILNSCLEEACIEETNAYVKAGLYSYSTKNPVVPDSLTLYGINMQTYKIYDKAKITPPLLIPLKDSADYSTLIIKINGVSDTLKFTYWSFPHLVTKECGYSMYHTVDTVYHTSHTIDSISKIDENITTTNAENIRIYY